ncbi:hypothetical protein [Actinoplanes sp. NPDC049265]|uniref:hypothetical protein n=1 Tax=Actinoplanes sp. NPDC049265 TaxID=3363902 RepID=UPI00371C437E
MAVDELWWSVFWPYAIVWTVTAVAFAGAVGVLVTLFLRRRRRGRTRHPTPGISVYLNRKRVMELYLRDSYQPAMSREFTKQISATTNANVAAELYGFQLGAGREVNEQVAEKFVQNAEPIAVIRVVMDVLEENGDILYIDLMDGAVEPDRSLAQRLTRNDRELPFDRLRRHGSFVSVWGSFREYARTGTAISFTASPPGGDQAVRVVFTCPLDEVSPDDVADGPFMARCLGRVQAWNEPDHTLLIRPVAVFN